MTIASVDVDVGRLHPGVKRLERRVREDLATDALFERRDDRLDLGDISIQGRLGRSFALPCLEKDHNVPTGRGHVRAG